jgi:hypothetical protein
VIARQKIKILKLEKQKEEQDKKYRLVLEDNFKKNLEIINLKDRLNSYANHESQKNKLNSVEDVSQNNRSYNIVSTNNCKKISFIFSSLKEATFSQISISVFQSSSSEHCH